MYIRNNDIGDFCTMISTCFLNGITDIRIFISEKEISNKIKFTYVLFTPLYTAIYSDNVNSTEYQKIYDTLTFCQDNNCNHEFRIQIFDDISFDENSNCLNVGRETNVI